MSELGLVHIVEMGGDQRSFPVNGEGITAREVIKDFFRVGADDVEELLDEKSFRIVNRGTLRADQLDDLLEHNTTITVYTQAIAKGGVPGARPCRRGFCPMGAVCGIGPCRLVSAVLA